MHHRDRGVAGGAPRAGRHGRGNTTTGCRSSETQPRCRGRVAARWRRRRWARRAPSPRRSPHHARRDRPGCRWRAAARRCCCRGFQLAGRWCGWRQGAHRAPRPTRRHRPWPGRPPDSRRPSRRRKCRSASLFGGYEMCGAPSPTLPRFAGEGVWPRRHSLSREAGEGWGGGATSTATLTASSPRNAARTVSPAPSAPPPASPRSPPSSPAHPRRTPRPA